MTSAHPPFSHNPHVYNGIDPDGNPTSGLVVHSTTAQVEDTEPVEVPDEAAGYDTLSKAELVAECEQRELPTTGLKADLVARLQEADQANAEPAEGGE